MKVMLKWWNSTSFIQQPKNGEMRTYLTIQFRWWHQIYRRVDVNQRKLQRVIEIFVSYLRAELWFGHRTHEILFFIELMQYSFSVLLWTFLVVAIVAEIQSLYTATELNIEDRFLDKVEEINILLCQANPQRANARKTVCPFLKEVVRSFIVMAQRGHDQLMDNLPTDWWWSN